MARLLYAVIASTNTQTIAKGKTQRLLLQYPTGVLVFFAISWSWYEEDVYKSKSKRALRGTGENAYRSPPSLVKLLGTICPLPPVRPSVLQRPSTASLPAPPSMPDPGPLGIPGGSNVDGAHPRECMHQYRAQAL